MGALFDGRDVFAVAATGAGKSLCFGLPALVLPGTAVVISPLLALMKDQMEKLESLGVPVCRLTTDLGRGEVRNALRNLEDYEIVYVSPEKARTKEFQAALSGVQVSLFALDEAHVASRAADFRPDYAHLAALLDDHPEAVRFACTATADTVVEQDVCRIFALRDPVRVVSSPWRSNISWEFARDATEGDLVDIVKEYHDRPGSQIVYVSSRRAAEELRHVLRSADIDAGYYHAGMERSVRMTTQEAFMSGALRTVVATTAFGMGVDKSDIRLVANFHMPSSMFDLLQQTGRASRDGAEALGWVNLGSKAEKAQRYFIEMSNPPFKVYRKLWERFSEQDGPARWTTDSLMRVGGIGENWSGWLTSALAYLEFTGHIAQTPAGTSYKLPVRDFVRASRVCALHGGTLKAGHVFYNVAPGQDDKAAAFWINGACESADPCDTLVIRPLAGALRFDADAIDAKREAADDQLQLIYDFAKADDRRGFVERLFAK